MTVADKNTQRILGFDTIKQEIARLAISELGRERMAALQPANDKAQIDKQYVLIQELMQLLNDSSSPPIGNLRDPRGLWEKLRPLNALLHPQELLEVENFLDTVWSTRRYFRQHQTSCPNCFISFNALKPFPELQKLIQEKITSKAEVKDTASELLGQLRREIQTIEARIHHKLEQMINGLRDSHVLQDFYFTIRNSRYVLPVQTISKGRIKGIIHAASHSGETVFIEPMEIVEDTNSLADLQLQEKQELRRILLAMADEIRPHLLDLVSNTELLGDLDCLYARACLASRFQLSIPEVNPEKPLSLIQQHHPLLYLRNPERSVPIDLQLNKQDRVLVISGPNTGGKTTALKTVGLTALMVQSALPVPGSQRSTLPLFNKIFADIGDEQDVSTGLSTFSAHIRNIARIIDGIDSQSLVLLDELGTATDPDEGSALAIAILEELANYEGLTLVASHLTALKQWAHQYLAARNAAFELDEATRRPNFLLKMDRPGISHAFLMAEHEGLPAQLIDKARQLLPQAERELSSLIASLQAKEQEIARRLSQVEKTEHQLQQQQEEAQRRLEELEKQRHGYRQRLLEEKEALLKEAKQFVEARIASLPSKQALDKARKELADELRKISQEQQQLQRQGQVGAEEQLRPVTVGDMVDLPRFNASGKVLEIDQQKKTVTVEVGNIQIKLPPEEIRPTPSLNGTAARAPAISYPRKDDVSYQLDLHGKRVDEAIELVDKYLDDAVLSHLSVVKLIHGHGRGKLRQALYEFLTQHVHVKSFQPGQPEQGGDAVTMVELTS